MDADHAELADHSDLAGHCATTAAGLTVPALVRRNAQTYPDLPALTWLGHDTPTITWGELGARVAALACGLSEIGLEPGERMLIMMSGRPEHWLLDLAATHVGAVSSTVYATLSPEQIDYIGRHSRARVLVLESAAELDRWKATIAVMPNLRRIVLLTDPEPADALHISAGELEALGAAALARDPDAFERRWRAVTSDQPVTLLYTSGTTGDPKGVLLSHFNVIYQAVVLEATVSFPDHGRSVAYLPLAHIAERMLGIYVPVYRAGHVHVCGDPATLAASLATTRPVSFFGVPRVWEKMAAGLQAYLAAADEPVRQAFAAAREATLTAHGLREAGRPVPADVAERVAQLDAVVLRPTRAMLGLDEVQWAGSGAAPIPVEVLLFLASIGLDVLEVWGMTETTGSATVNTPAEFRTGTVGRAQPGMELRLADDGEILVRGPLVALGYLGADGGVAPMTDVDGWLATGDVGTLDADGYLTITDRKKDLIITSNGKNIAPTAIENLLRAHPLIGQAVAIGDRRPYVTALIVPDEEMAVQWATARGIGADLAELAGHPDLLAEISAAVATANAKLSRPEQVKAFRVLPDRWTPDSGEVTPKLSVRRKVVGERYAEVIDALYAG